MEDRAPRAWLGVQRGWKPDLESYNPKNVETLNGRVHSARFCLRL